MIKPSMVLCGLEYCSMRDYIISLRKYVQVMNESLDFFTIIADDSAHSVHDW